MSEFYSPLTPQNQKNFYPSKFAYFPLSEGPETWHTGREEDYPEAFFFVCRNVAPFSRFGIFSDRCQKMGKFSNSVSRNFSLCDWPQIRPVCRGWQALQNALTSLRISHSVLKIPWNDEIIPITWKRSPLESPISSSRAAPKLGLLVEEKMSSNRFFCLAINGLVFKILPTSFG